MSVNVNSLGKWAKSAIVALGLGAMALPMTGAFATGDDPTQPAAPVEGGLTVEQMEASSALFNQYSCGACHVLGEAGGNGHIGPQLDGNLGLDKDYIVNIVSNGQGAMPSFGGMIGEDEIDQLATYILQVKK